MLYLHLAKDCKPPYERNPDLTGSSLIYLTFVHLLFNHTTYTMHCLQLVHNLI